MQLFAISGFFGSGKTTLVLQLARHLVVGQGRKVVIIQNEIGKVGVDDLLLKSQGLQTRELLGGCICCQLQNGMIATLRTAAAEHRPDAFIVEASGMATPAMLRAIFAAAELPLVPPQLWVLFDAARLQKLRQVAAAPFLNASMKAADALVLNKLDAAPPRVAGEFRAAAHAQNPTATLIETSLRELSALPSALAELAAPNHRGEEERRDGGDGENHRDSHPRHRDHHHHHHPGDATGQPPVVTAQQRYFHPPPTVTRRTLAVALEGLARALQADGAVLIGHLKLFAEIVGGPPITASVTRFDEPALPTSHPATAATPGTAAADAPDAPVALAALTVNAIAHGLPADRLAAAVDDLFARLAPGAE